MAIKKAKIFLVLFLGISVLFDSWDCSAQTTVSRGVEIRNNNQIKSKTRNTYAMIFGVSSYRNLRPLKFADKDAILFKNFLLSPGGGSVPSENILLYTNEKVTTGELTAKCFEWLNRRPVEVNKNDRIYFYLSGHGDGYLDKYFYFTYDADTSSGPKNYQIQGNIKISDLKESLEYYVKKGAEVIFIVDACRTNETSTDSEKIMAERFSSLSKERNYLPGFYTIYAAKDGQVAYESSLVGGGHGLFSYYLIEGMLGKADNEFGADNNGVVTLFELTSWLKKVIPMKAKEILKQDQLPQYCCQVDDDNAIAYVNKEYLLAYEEDQQRMSSILSDTGSDYTLALKTGLSTRTNVKSGISKERELIDIYNKCVNLIKEGKLIGRPVSALEYYNQMAIKWVDDELTIDIKLTLIKELIDKAQATIRLYLTGADIGYVNQQADANGITGDQYIKLRQISTSSFGNAALNLQTAIDLLGQENEIAKKLFPKLWFLQARSYFDNPSTLGLNQAIQLAEKALQQDTAAVHIYHLLAMLEMEKDKNSVKAEQYFLKAYEGESNWSKASIELGYYYFQSNRFDEASIYYRIGLLNTDNYAIAYNNLALASIEGHNYEDAEKYFKLGILKKPNDKYLINNLSVFYNIRGQEMIASKRFLEAEYLFKSSAVINPRSPFSYTNLGNIYLTLKKYSKSREAYKKALAYNSFDIDAGYNIAVLYYVNRKYDSAIYYLDLIKRHVKTNSKMNRQIVDLRQNCKVYQARFLNSNKPLEDQPAPELDIDTTQSSLEVAKLFLSIREYKKAETYLLNAINENSKNQIALIEIARLNALLDQESKTEKYYNAAIAAGPENSVPKIELANLYNKSGRYKDAVALLQPSAAKEVNNVAFQITFGTAFEKQHLNSQAEQVFLNYYFKVKNDRVIIKELVRFYLLTGNTRQAEFFRTKLRELE